MHPTASESNLTKSVGAFLKAGLPNGTEVVNAEEYEALSQAISETDTFVIFQLGNGSGSNKEYRDVSVGVLTRNDPGNGRLLSLLDKLKELLAPGLSIPFLDFTGGSNDVVTQMVVRSAKVKMMIHEQDDRRSKTLEVELTYPKIY